MYFKSLRIQNFQAHEDLRIDFGNITSIVGPTDAGKSSVIRALCFVLFNRPNGTEFVRHGAEVAEVTLELADGTTVTRRRGRKPTLNEYIINGSTVLKAFSTGVPEEVSKILRVPPGCVQEQHDPHFWVSLSPSALGVELNRVVDLELIGKAMSLASKRSRDASAVYKNTQNEVEKKRGVLRKYTWARELRRDCIALQEARERHETERRRASTLRELGKRVSVHRLHLDAAVETLREAQIAAKAGEVWSQCVRDRKKLTSIATTLARVSQELEEKQKAFSVLEQKLKELPPICPSCKRPLERK